MQRSLFKTAVHEDGRLPGILNFVSGFVPGSATLDDYLLADIGMSRGEVTKPFLQS